jgi:transposase
MGAQENSSVRLFCVAFHGDRYYLSSMNAAHKIPLDDAEKLRDALSVVACESDMPEFIDLVVTMLMKLSGDHQTLLLRLKKMLQSKYTGKSETLNAAQLQLFKQALQTFEQTPQEDAQQATDETTETKADNAKKPNRQRKKGHGRNPFPAHLPREECVIAVPQAERQCVTCGGAKVCMGHTASERIDFRPATLFVLLEKREKLACKFCQGEIVIAETAPHIVEGGIAGEGLLSHIVVAKFVDGMPLTRLSKIFRREGVHLAESTLGDLVRQTAEQLGCLATYIGQRVLDAPYINQDDTGLPVLDRDHPKGIKKGHIWGYVHKRDVVFDYTPNWQGIHPRTYLKDYRGIIQGDGYSGIDRLFTGEVHAPIRAGCMMHCRRYFYEAYKTGDPAGGIALALIHDIYRIEARAKELGLSDNERLVVRKEQSIPLMQRLRVFIDTTRPRAAPKTYLGRAITYATNQWQALLVPFERGEMEIDNGEIERRFKAVAIARKNFLFAGSDKAATRTAVLLTVLSTAVAHGIDPFIYLKDVLGQIADGLPFSRIGELHPVAWADKRGQQLDAYRIPVPRLVQ